MRSPTCTHDLVLFGSDEELIGAVAPFVAEGVAVGDWVLVHGDPDEFAALHEALAGPGVEFSGAGYATPIAALAGFQQLCDAETAAGRPVRGVGPVPVGAGPGARAEWVRYEALVARALAPYLFAGLCLYDTRLFPPDLVEQAYATHRRVRDVNGVHPNERARPDVEVLDDTDTTQPLPGPPSDARTVLALDLPVDATAAALSTPRRALRRALRDTGLPSGRIEEYLTAVGEVLTNAVQHGRGPVQVRLLTEQDRWWCTVTDHGPGIGDRYAGIDSPLPGNPDAHGAGLWVARQFADQLTIADHADSTRVTIRLHA